MQGIGVGTPDNLTLITSDNKMWLYVNGILEVNAFPLFRNEGYFSVNSSGESTCEFENIYAYTWED